MRRRYSFKWKWSSALIGIISLVTKNIVKQTSHLLITFILLLTSAYLSFLWLFLLFQEVDWVLFNRFHFPLACNSHEHRSYVWLLMPVSLFHSSESRIYVKKECIAWMNEQMTFFFVDGVVFFASVVFQTYGFWKDMERKQSRMFGLMGAWNKDQSQRSLNLPLLLSNSREKIFWVKTEFVFIDPTVLNTNRSAQCSNNDSNIIFCNWKVLFFFVNTKVSSILSSLLSLPCPHCGVKNEQRGPEVEARRPGGDKEQWSRGFMMAALIKMGAKQVERRSIWNVFLKLTWKNLKSFGDRKREKGMY